MNSTGSDPDRMGQYCCTVRIEERKKSKAKLSEQDFQRVSHLHAVQARQFVKIADELRRYRRKTGHYIWYVFPTGAPGNADFEGVTVPHRRSSNDPNVREAVPDPPGSTVWLEALFGAEGGVGNVKGCVNGDITDQSDPVPTWRGLLEWIAKQQEERVKVEGNSDQLTPPTDAVLPSIDHGRIWYWLALFGPAAEAAAAESRAGEAKWGRLRDVCRTLAKYDWKWENGPVPGIGQGRVEAPPSAEEVVAKKPADPAPVPHFGHCIFDNYLLFVITPGMFNYFREL